MSDASEAIHILITIPLKYELLDEIRSVSPRVELLHYPAESARDIPDEMWGQARVLYTIDVLPEPALAPALQWIHVHRAGVDTMLDHPLLQQEGMQLTTASGIHTTNIAEYAFMMMLAFGHRLPTMIARQREADWPEDKFKIYLPVELRGSTLGIVGYGNIGREIARLARAFGMEVLASKRDVRQPADLDSYVPPGTGDPEGVYFDRLYPPEAVATMVRECDFVVLTTPLTEATRHLIDADVLDAMKPTAYLINVSRGGVVDEKALLGALRTGGIAGYASDVFESEPLPADSPLWKQPNILISPHISGNTRDYDAKAIRLFTENLRRYVARKELLNVVDRTRGY